MRASDPMISFVIVNWNTRHDLLDCLGSMKANPPSSPWEVIVVDNASSDDSVRALTAQTPWVNVIANEVNLGLAAGNNQGMKAARGSTIVISNPDVRFEKGSVDALVDVLDRVPRAGMVFAHLLDPDGTDQTSAGSLPRLWEAILGRQLMAPRGGTKDRFWWHGWAHDEETMIGHGGESCYAVRRATIDEVGLQDERFPLDWEGIEWCARAWRAGWEVWFCPAATVVHLGGRSLSQARARWVVSSHLGMYRYFAMRTRAPFRPLLAALIAIRTCFKLVAVASPSVSRKLYRRRHR